MVFVYTHNKLAITRVNVHQTSVLMVIVGNVSQTLQTLSLMSLTVAMRRLQVMLKQLLVK
jgi:hypothetical protein